MRAPEIECQTQETADATAASGIAGKCFVARTVASPAFCIPTSIEIVRRFAVLKRAAAPVR